LNNLFVWLGFPTQSQCGITDCFSLDCPVLFLRPEQLKAKLSDQIVSEIRKTVESLGFVEVETPVLQVC